MKIEIHKLWKFQLWTGFLSPRHSQLLLLAPFIPCSQEITVVMPRCHCPCAGKAMPLLFFKKLDLPDPWNWQLIIWSGLKITQINPGCWRHRVMVVILWVYVCVCYHTSCYIPHLHVQSEWVSTEACWYLWLHDCMLCIFFPALNVLRQLRHWGFCTIVLHFYYLI